MSSVLIVEDEVKIRDVFIRFLNAKGFAAREAKDGLEAVELAGHQHFDLIVMDLKMPKLDGLSAFEQIRQAQPEVPVIFITGYRVNDQLNEALKLPGVAYLHKPFTFEDLAAAINRMAVGPQSGESHGET